MLGARFRMGKKQGREWNGWKGRDGMDILWTGARQRTGKLQSEKQMEANESLSSFLLFGLTLSLFLEILFPSLLSLFILDQLKLFYILSFFSFLLFLIVDLFILYFLISLSLTIAIRKESIVILSIH
jgi:hypothetical protein